MLSKYFVGAFILQLFFTAVLMANTTNAQKSLNDITVTVQVESSSLDEIIQQLKEQSGFQFSYDDSKVEIGSVQLSLDKVDEPLIEVLKEISKNSNLKFVRVDDLIHITRKKDSELPVRDDVISEKITGTVISASDGNPIPGATVRVKGGTKGTVTDIEGDFTLEVSPDDVLVFSFVGFKNKEITVGNQANFTVSLEEDLQSLEEVVVVGYGEQKKETLTGSVSSVKGKDIVKSPVTNVSQGLAGRLPGVVVPSNTSEPGYDGTTIRIRGINTFGNASPLIVVDGVPGRSLERIDPNTIESISVLKDASAAIYGAQAANGVILITTKRGETGKPSVNFSHNQGISRPTVIPEMANSAEYATLLNEVDHYNGNPGRYTEKEIEKYRNGSEPWLYPNTDWFAETLKPWSAQSNSNVNVNGGAENLKYFVSASRKSQDGFYRNSATKYKQYDLRSNLDFKFNDHINMYMNLNGRMEDRNFPTRSAENIFRMIMRSKPNFPAYWPNGLPGPDIEFGDNPVVISTNATGYSHDKRYIFNSDFGLNVKLPWVEGLTLTAKASLDKRFYFNKVWQTPWYLYTWDRTSYDENGDPLLVKGKEGFNDPRLFQSTEDSKRALLSGLVNYNRTFDQDHTVGFLAGVEKITGKGDSFNAFRRYYISTAIDQLFAGGREEINNNGSAYEQARLNYFGRTNYSYKNKYLAEFVWRYQGSYIFEESNRYGFFPGVSLGYVISEEDFWSNSLPFIDFMKIRASWGKTGNDLISPYQYLATYSFSNLLFIADGGNALNQALREGVAPNRGVTWETAIQQNIGVDMDFLEGDLTFTADYFLNKRKDILWARNASVPNTTGLSLPDENIGEFQNQGVDFNLQYRKRLSAFSYGIGLNGVYTKNEILFWDEPPGAPEYQQSTGSPIGSSLYYNAIGIFQNEDQLEEYPHWDGARPGDVIFEDYNNDGVIDANDRVRHDRSRTPIFTGGLNIDLSYKGFDLAILLQGAAGGVFYQTTESGDFGNYLKSFYENRWTEENPSNTHPRTYNRTGEYWVNQRNTYWLHKSDYIRLKNIELGYTVPNALTSRYGINSLRLNVSAFNLLTFSPDMKDYDPENTSGSGYNYPLNKVLNFGLSVSF